jgi:uncharacterized protein YcnI
MSRAQAVRVRKLPLTARVGLILGVAGVAVFGVAAPAGAHVTVEPATATPGGFVTLTFRVPNEATDASTVKVEIELPQNAPITSVATRPLAGWSAEVQRRTLATPVPGAHGAQVTDVVSRVVWTAEPGAGIGPGQFQEFDLSAGPLPEVDVLVFKALQHYSDGEVVRWIDEPNPGIDLEHPAPVVRLTATSDAPAPAGRGSDGGAALVFGIAGAVLGLAGLLLGLLAYRRAATR